MIQGTCYFFEKTKQDFLTAQENCNTKFSPDAGKVFEPSTLELYDEIFAAAKSTFGGSWLLTGFEKNDDNGDQVEYSSTGTESNIQPWSQNDIKGNNKPYLTVNIGNSKWQSRPDNFKAYSVCEKVSSSGIPSTPGSKSIRYILNSILIE